MKLQYTLISLAVINVVCCYPSSGDDSHPGTVLSSSESQLDNDNNFPEVTYPTKILNTNEPFYYRSADDDETLAPFSIDVKDSFKSLEAEQKTKEYSVLQDYNSPQIIDIKQTAEKGDDQKIVDTVFYNADNASNESVRDGNLEVTSELNVQSSHTNDQLKFEKNVPSGKPINSTECSMEIPDDTNYHFNINNGTNVDFKPTSKPTNSTETSVEASDTDCQINIANEETDSIETSVTIQDDSPEVLDDTVSFN